MGSVYPSILEGSSSIHGAREGKIRHDQPRGFGQTGRAAPHSILVVPSDPTHELMPAQLHCLKPNPLFRSIWKGTESDEIRLLSIFGTVRNRCDFPLDLTIPSSNTPSAIVLSFATASSGIAPFEAVSMNNPPVFFTFAPSVWMKLTACLSSTPLKIGVRESSTTVTGPPFALAMKAVIWIFSSVRSDGSLIAPSPCPANPE